MSIERALGSVSISDIWGQSTTKKMRRRAREDARVAREDDVAAGTAPGARANRYRPKRLPADIMPLIGEAHGELASGNEARAIELLTEVVRRAPEHPEAYGRRADLPSMSRGGAVDRPRRRVAATSRGRDADSPRRRRRGDAAAATWIFKRDEHRAAGTAPTSSARKR